MKKLNELESNFQMIGTMNNGASEKQRTDDWLKDRNGCWNGSENKNLMKSGRASAKMGWDNPNKIFDFGVTAEKHIYKIGKQRESGVVVESMSSKQMMHGVIGEPIVKENLLKQGVITDLEEVGSLPFGDYKLGRSSADGICKYKGERVNLEIKCPVSWDGFCSRTYEKVHDKHDDFWQIQSEMLSTKTNKTLFVVAYPMSYEIFDLQLVSASKIHQEALVHRCKIGDLAIKLWGEYGYQEALKKACFDYKLCFD